MPPRMRPCAVAYLTLAALTLTGCASVPMGSHPFPRPSSKPARCLLVFLPGAGDSGESFAEEGFVDAVRKAGLSVDMVGADATWPYYSRKTAFERIRIDVVEPARRKGYAKTWVAGISMGGMGALLFARKEPQMVDGVLALAPYLGDADLHREIDEAGGLKQWSPPGGDLRNYQRDLWRWLKARAEHAEQKPSVYLGYGDEDGKTRAHKLLESAFANERIFHAPGGHEWKPWRELFARFLAESDFGRECRDSPAKPKRAEVENDTQSAAPVIPALSAPPATKAKSVTTRALGSEAKKPVRAKTKQRRK